MLYFDRGHADLLSYMCIVTGLCHEVSALLKSHPLMLEIIAISCLCMSFLMCYCSITHYLFLGFIYGTIDTV